MKPKDVLTPADYQNYRNVRAVAFLFVFVSIIPIIIGVILLTTTYPPNQSKTATAMFNTVGVIALIVAAAGIVGGVAVLRGDRKLKPLIYVTATMYVGYFPIGTLLSIILLKGLRRYFDSKDLISNATRSSG